MELCYILFGSNLGDKMAVFEQACRLISNRCGKIVRLSSAYESEPWGFEATQWFLNRLIVIETPLAPDDLMEALLAIESELGRVRFPEQSGYASRVIDLDILYYGDKVLHADRVMVPHPRLHLRRFVLAPLCEVAPDFMHPVFHVSNKELLSRCQDSLEVRILEGTNE